jgi:hypothetical protein
MAAQSQLQQYKVLKFAKDGYTCNCVTCTEVVAKLQATGKSIQHLLTSTLQRDLDQALAGQKVMILQTRVVPGESSGCIPTCQEVSTKSICYVPCKECNNEVQCEFSEYVTNQCAPLDTALIALCSPILFPREHVRMYTVTENKSPEEIYSFMWTYYKLALYLSEVCRP